MHVPVPPHAADGIGIVARVPTLRFFQNVQLKNGVRFLDRKPCIIRQAHNSFILQGNSQHVPAPDIRPNCALYLDRQLKLNCIPVPKRAPIIKPYFCDYLFLQL